MMPFDPTLLLPRLRLSRARVNVRVGQKGRGEEKVPGVFYEVSNCGLKIEVHHLWSELDFHWHREAVHQPL